MRLCLGYSVLQLIPGRKLADAQPSGEKGTAYAVHCHTEMQTRRGIWNIENLDLKPLVDAKIYEFAFIWSPLKIIGGTGSPGNPIAIY